MTSNGIGKFSINNIKGLPFYCKYKVEDLSKNDSYSKKVKIILSNKAPVGKNIYRLRFQLNNKVIPEESVFLLVDIKSSVEFKYDRARGTNDLMTLGRVNNERGCVKEIIISNRDDKLPYYIDDINITSNCNENIVINENVITPGSSYKMILIIKPYIKSNYIKGKIIISSKHADLHSKVIDFYGAVIR